MSTIVKNVDALIAQLRPITLEEMSAVKLMNRTDTKFVTTVEKLCQLLEMVQERYRVQDIDGRRNMAYYTVYFDTPDLNMFLTHHNGVASRQKLRIRSYVESHLNFLEVKTKDNHKRTKKKRVEAVGFDPENPDLDMHFDAHNEVYADYDKFLRKHLRYDPASMVQTLENRFRRITLVNEAHTERVTIDTGLRFHNLLTDRRCSLDGLAIIELKRDGLMPSDVLEMLLQLRIRPQGFSKYCMGTALTNPDVKQNRFKQRLRLIDKMMHTA